MSKKPKCYDCGRPYGNKHGFPDLIIPNWAWRAISPKERKSQCQKELGY